MLFLLSLFFSPLVSVIGGGYDAGGGVTLYQEMPAARSRLEPVGGLQRVRKIGKDDELTQGDSAPSDAAAAWTRRPHGSAQRTVCENFRGAGFEGILASGLALSASYGVRDNNDLFWSQVTDHVTFMGDCTTMPILLDGDTGYGNFNNMRRLAHGGLRGVELSCLSSGERVAVNYTMIMIEHETKILH